MPILLRAAPILFLISAAWCLPQNFCGPTPEIQTKLKKASSEIGPDPTDFERNVAPYRALRRQVSQDLFVQESYQNAVQQHGIEGHLRTLIEEYQTLQTEHAEDWKYQYLFSRALVGRNTPSAIQGISQIAREHPEFAPAHRSLAEIYGSEAFADPAKEEIEHNRFLALCPGSTVTKRPYPLPDPSTLVAEAEHQLEEAADPTKVVQMAKNGIRADEWRLQRIRPFDWYSVKYKKQQQLELQIEYWRMWTLEVRVYRKAQQLEKADELLKEMEQRSTFLLNEPDTVQWSALSNLARLYEEGKQKDIASQKLEAMRQLLAKHPDSNRTAQLETLQRELD